MRALLLLLYNALLVDLAIKDAKTRTIKNESVCKICILAMIAVFVMPEISIGSRILGLFAVSVPMGCVKSWKAGSFGGGDVKFVFASGGFLGAELVLSGTIIALLLAGVYCVYLICIKKKYKNVQFALGPFLCAGHVLTACSLF